MIQALTARLLEAVPSLNHPVVNAATKVDPNKALRVARSWAYPKQVLYFLSSFIALVTLLHYSSLSYRYATRKRVYTSAQRTSSSLRRLPLAVLDSLKAIAFRWTIPVGSNFSLNLAEVGVTIGYIAVLLSWTFVNSECS